VSLGCSLDSVVGIFVPDEGSVGSTTVVPVSAFCGSLDLSGFLGSVFGDDADSASFSSLIRSASAA